MLSDYEKTIRRSLAKNEETIRRAESLVREAGYNYAQLNDMRGVRPTGAISRAFNLYFLAKELLHHVDPDNAEAFIQSAYGANNNG